MPDQNTKPGIKMESAAFLEFSIRSVAMATGMTAHHSHLIAEAIVFAHLQGKLNQGLGVYEAIELAFQGGALDVTSTPEMIDEGPAWAVVDGKRSSGYYTLSVMAEIAIEKAKSSGIAIVYGGNHNDAGSFARYVYSAYEQDMVAFSSNNTVPLCAPYGGMENKLSCPPFDGIFPNENEPPIWISTKFGEFYDADISEAVLQNQPMKGKWLIDPVTGDLSDRAEPYAAPIEGFGRVWDYTCGGQIEEPRTYAMNMWNEGLSAIVNPIGIPSTAMPTIEDYEAGNDPIPSVGGSYYICINPSTFGPIGAMKKRADDYVKGIRETRPRPGHSVRVPGEQAFRALQETDLVVEVLEHHWQPFFDFIAKEHGLSEKTLRQNFEAESADT